MAGLLQHYVATPLLPPSFYLGFDPLLSPA
jgi:hypothetical protein